jgi:hypothetical protein
MFTAMADDKTQAGAPDRARLSKLENYEWAYEVLKLHREFSRATRAQVLDALDTAYEQNVSAPMRDRIEEFARGLLKEWLARA